MKADFICKFSSDISSAQSARAKDPDNNTTLKKSKSDVCQVYRHERQDHGSASVHQHHERQ